MDEIVSRAPVRPPPRRRINFEDPHCRPIHLAFDTTEVGSESGVFSMALAEEEGVITVSDDESCIIISSDIEDEDDEVFCIPLDEDERETLQIRVIDQEVSSILIDENEDDKGSPSPPNPKRCRFL